MTSMKKGTRCLVRDRFATVMASFKLSTGDKRVVVEFDSPRGQVEVITEKQIQLFQSAPSAPKRRSSMVKVLKATICKNCEQRIKSEVIKMTSRGLEELRISNPEVVGREYGSDMPVVYAKGQCICCG